MYAEEVAILTAKHLREHIQDYLDYVQQLHHDSVKIQMPKSIETDNLVGGVYNTKLDAMPAYAVDIISKAFTERLEDLWLYSYDGHIAGVVSGQDEVAVNRLIKRHEAAAEMFVKRHEFMHQVQSELGADFSIRQLGFTGAAYSGAELVEERDNRQVWMAGFRIDLIWIVSEDGPHQHG